MEIKQIIKDIAELAAHIKPGELQDDDYAYYEKQLICAMANTSHESSGLHKHDVSVNEVAVCPYCKSKLLHYSYPDGWECHNCDESWGRTER